MCKKILNLFFEWKKTSDPSSYFDEIKEIKDVKVRSVVIETEEAIDIYKSRTQFLESKKSPIKGIESLLENVSINPHKKVVIHHFSHRKVNYLVFTDMDITQVFGVLELQKPD